MPRKKSTTTKNQNDDFENDSNDCDYFIPPNAHNEFNAKSAAEESRMKYNHMTHLEKMYFTDIDSTTYLDYRNSILRMWLNKPSIGLTFEMVKSKLKIHDKKKIHLVKNIMKFLERYGYINFGVFENHLPEKCVNPSNRRRKVCVIGAGISGLIAARQLMYFGFDVEVFEASQRIGGRCYAFYKNEMFFDLGAVLVSGIKGNPIRTIMKQLNLNAKQLNPKHKLYMDGVLVDKKKEFVIHKLFLLFVRTLYYISVEKGETEINGQQLSIENVFDLFLFFLETCSTSKSLEHNQKLLNLEENISTTLNPLVKEFKQFLDSRRFFYSFAQTEIEATENEMDDDDDDFDRSVVFNETHFRERSMPTSGQVLKSHLAFLKCIRYLRTHLQISIQKEEELKSDKFNECTHFLSTEDRRIFEWYLGTLEFFLGAPMSEYSLKKFASEDFVYSDKMYQIPNGYMNLLQALYSKGCSMKIRKRTQAKKIILKDHSVEVIAIKDNDPMQMVHFQGDAVICTLPLGVLKKAIIDDQTENFIENHVIFEPPLPAHKKAAIERFGFGTINKVIMGFEQNLWESNEQYIGNVAMSRECRGEFLFRFFHSPPQHSKDHDEQDVKNKKKKKPKKIYSVTSIVCGKSIDVMSELDNPITYSSCYNGFKEIYENAPPLKGVSVTHWEKNPFYLGTHSYPSTKCTLDDYDALAEPVRIRDGHRPRLYFAGEHTSKVYASTVHGAFLSGLRAASELADHFDPLNI